MKRKRNPSGCGLGRLPERAPLANPYVPFQMEDPPRYEARQGLIRGTMFPGLDLPFQGKVNRKELTVTPMSDLQALHFALQELALYLDTHRDDARALEIFREYQKLYKECRARYQEKYGPLSLASMDDCTEYRWLDDPWPWEYCKNKGG